MLEGEPTKTYAYTYGNAWKDQLTGFDGQSIVYDASGNPTSYLGATLSWSRGRLLTNYVSGYNTVSMQYDANGIRSQKIRINTNPNTIGDISSTSYIYDSNGRLRTETKDGVTRRFFYSSNGVEGFEEDGARYLYRKNLFGDITAIYQGTTKVAEYTYDAWGNCTIIQNTNGIGTRNPFRYRGYYFDTDLNLYYLMSRYYDPKTGRFINADSFEYLDPKSINGLNLYAYCKNNPIMHIDPSGHDLITLLVVGFFATVTAGIGVVIMAIGVIIGILFSEIGDNIKEAGSKLFEGFINLTGKVFGGDSTENVTEGLMLAPSTPHIYKKPADWLLDEIKVTME